LSKLKRLELAGNNIEHFDVNELPKSLEWLVLSNNRISRIPDLRNLTNLRYLFLECNRLSEPKDVEQFKKIDNIFVNIYGNPFCETLKKKGKIILENEVERVLCPLGSRVSH